MDEVPFALDNSFKLSDSEAFEPTNENIIVAPSKVSRGDSCMLMSDSDSELDPNDIIQDIPIYLSQQLTNELYIIQYPVRPRTNPYDGNNIPREARFKQLSQKLELDIPLQTNSQWYNHDRGEELALGLNDKEARTIYDRSWRRERNDGLLDKQTLQSTIVQPQANYWMGVVKDGGLHMTPVHTTLQLRPGLKYLDKIDEKLKNASKKAQAMEEEDLVNDLKSVKLNQEDPGVGSSKGKGSGRGRPSGTTGDDKTSDKSSLKKNTRPTSSRMVEEEKWKKMKYFDDNSTETEVILNKMYALQTVLLECKTKNISEYIDAISTFPKTIDESSSNLEEGQPSEINATPFNSLRPELNQMPIPVTPLTPNVINPLTANKTPSNPPTRTVSRSRGSIVPVRSGRVGALRGPGRVIRGKRGQTSRPKSS